MCHLQLHPAGGGPAPPRAPITPAAPWMPRGSSLPAAPQLDTERQQIQAPLQGGREGPLLLQDAAPCPGQKEGGGSSQRTSPRRRGHPPPSPGYVAVAPGPLSERFCLDFIGSSVDKGALGVQAPCEFGQRGWMKRTGERRQTSAAQMPSQWGSGWGVPEATGCPVPETCLRP